jgi:hypothetical protein
MTTIAQRTRTARIKADHDHIVTILTRHGIETRDIGHCADVLTEFMRHRIQDERLEARSQIAAPRVTQIRALRELSEKITS